MFKKQASKAVIFHTDFFFLQLRDNKKTILYPNKWCFFGGGVKSGETPLSALKRELIEELSFSTSNLIFEFEFFNYDSHTNIFFYSVRLNSMKKFLVNEGQKGEWIKKNNLKKLNLAPDTLHYKENILNLK